MTHDSNPPWVLTSACDVCPDEAPPAAVAGNASQHQFDITVTVHMWYAVTRFQPLSGLHGKVKGRNNVLHPKEKRKEKSLHFSAIGD